MVSAAGSEALKSVVLADIDVICNVGDNDWFVRDVDGNRVGEADVGGAVCDINGKLAGSSVGCVVGSWLHVSISAVPVGIDSSFTILLHDSSV